VTEHASSCAGTVREALARLREAGRALRARTPASVQAALGDALDALCAAGSGWQRALADALAAPSGFAPETIREGLARGLAPYTGEALRALVRAELGEPGAARGFDVTASVLAGAIPMPTVVSMLAPLALCSPVLVKLAAPDPVTAPLFARALAERDLELGAAVAVADFRHDDEPALTALCQADCVVATGSDRAVSALAARVAPPRRFVGHGHRFSLALLGPGATRGEALASATEGLALDVALWDQLGCLSPVSVHAADPDPRAAERVAEALAGALARVEVRLPRGRIGVETAAAIARARAEAELRAAVIASPGTAWTVACERDPALRPSPLHRFVRVHPARDAGEALAALRPHAAQLAAVALAGFGAQEGALASQLLELGASRTCPPGQLQSPPLSWPRDGMGVLLPLAHGAGVP
jgi:hypothetical protein